MGAYEGAAVLVTGAAGGFGRAAAFAFAREGARLLLCDIDAERLDALAGEMRETGARVEALAGDVAGAAAHAALVARAVEAFGRLDVAVNNAGIAHPFARLPQIEDAAAERVIAVNLLGVFHAMKAQIPQMERQFRQGGKGGVILNVASVAGVVGAPLLSAYAAAKHGVVGLTRSAAGECAARGVRVNALCPAFADTAMVHGSLDRMIGSREEATSRVVQNVPMRRLARPEEVVAAMLFACAPENGFMTGHALVVDGGLSAV